MPRADPRVVAPHEGVAAVPPRRRKALSPSLRFRKPSTTGVAVSRCPRNTFCVCHIRTPVILMGPETDSLPAARTLPPLPPACLARDPPRQGAGRRRTRRETWLTRRGGTSTAGLSAACCVRPAARLPRLPLLLPLFLRRHRVPEMRAPAPARSLPAPGSEPGRHVASCAPLLRVSPALS